MERTRVPGGRWLLVALILLMVSAVPAVSQIVRNGGFEETPVGVYDSTMIHAWEIQVDTSIVARPVFEVVSDTVHSGSRALKVQVHGLGPNAWSVQISADSLAVRPGPVYHYSVWAKSLVAGGKANFTVWSQAGGEYKRIDQQTLTTTWTKYEFTFTVTDKSRFIRAPIHFGLAADTNNTVYIDDLEVYDQSIPNQPVLIEAESGTLGGSFATHTDTTATYINATSASASNDFPADAAHVATYSVTFADSGSYYLYARIRVDTNGTNNSSFFYANTFGTKSPTTAADWTVAENLGGAGVADSAKMVDAPGLSGGGVWKWINLKNAFGGAAGQPFVVTLDSLTKTFQVGGREAGLQIDKFAFGKTSMHYWAGALDSTWPGRTAADTGTIWAGPALASASTGKFLGCSFNGHDPNFALYWNQVTPENAGKFGSVGITADSSTWAWTGLDSAYNFAKHNGMVFKMHNLVWGAQQPSWLTGGSLTNPQIADAMESWIRQVGHRYPNMDLVDVVNEPLAGHNPPSYAEALGGAGTTGWDWVIWAFTKARQYMPTAKLILNDYGIINDNTATTNYLVIINLLKDRGLIDGIGVQGHRFELQTADTATYRSNINRLAATGLPIYISELDLGNNTNTATPNDTQQLTAYKKVFTLLWKHPAVKGITLWGYIEGTTWQPNVHLIKSTGFARPAFLWLANFVASNPTDVTEPVSGKPTTFALDQNYPNPFNPTTIISFSMAQAGNATLVVYDLLGREVSTLVNGFQTAGHHAVTFDARSLSTGVYFYRLTTDRFTATKKLMLLK